MVHEVFSKVSTERSQYLMSEALTEDRLLFWTVIGIRILSLLSFPAPLGLSAPGFPAL